MITNPFIKKQANKDWLENNQETFLDYMAKRHSLTDCWHTVLHPETFDDAYVENMIKEVEKADKRKIKEDAARKKKLKTPAASATEKKMNAMEENADRLEKEKQGEGLFDD